MYLKPSSSDCFSASRPYLRKRTLRPALAIPLTFAIVDEKMLPMPRPRLASCAWLIWLTEWRAVMCPISWPRTETSSASLFMCVRMPRVMKTGPPGRAKALTAASSMTLNCQGIDGRSDFEAICIPRRET